MERNADGPGLDLDLERLHLCIGPAEPVELVDDLPRSLTLDVARFVLNNAGDLYGREPTRRPAARDHVVLGIEHAVVAFSYWPTNRICTRRNSALLPRTLRIRPKELGRRSRGRCKVSLPVNPSAPCDFDLCCGMASAEVLGPLSNIKSGATRSGP